MQPSPADTEDDYVAYERNTKLLIAEVMKSRSKKETIILLLAETFPTRRRYIQDSQSSICELAKELPFLGFNEWVSQSLCNYNT